MKKIIPKLDSQKGTLEILLFLNEKKKAILTEILNAVKVSIGPVYKSIDVLKEIDLIREERITFPRTRIFYPTPDGEKIANKLELVFDEKKEIFPLGLDQVEKLEKACAFKEIKAEGIETWQDFIKKAIEEKYQKFSVGKNFYE